MKNILVTSGTSGIGAAIAQKIASDIEVANLFVNYGHNDEKAKEFYNDLPKEIRPKVHLVKADMSCEEGLNSLVDYVKSKVDSLDWLICNTGIGDYRPFDEYTMESWNKVITTNLTIPTFLVQKIKPMINNGGKIIFMASYSGIVPYSSSVVYGASKAAICFMAKTLMKEFDQKNVCVNAIAPGFIETEWQRGRSDESRERINRKIACHRFGTPQEVAKICVDVLTNDYINGAVIDITGGYNYF